MVPAVFDFCTNVDIWFNPSREMIVGKEMNKERKKGSENWRNFSLVVG